MARGTLESGVHEGNEDIEAPLLAPPITAFFSTCTNHLSSGEFLPRIKSGQKTSPFCGLVAVDTGYHQGKADAECPVEGGEKAQGVGS